MSSFLGTNSLSYMVCPFALLRTGQFLTMAASLLTNASHSRSLTSGIVATASLSSAVHSPTPTVLGNDESPAQSETECGDVRIELYGGDKPQDSTLKEPAVTLLPFLPQPNTDPNSVTWDGPDDPANPQNWSFWYKSWLTAICSLMTVTVYVHRSPCASCPWLMDFDPG